ncbi:MAG: two-component regulator propeller domain-containing protein [Prevotella sp.]
MKTKILTLLSTLLLMATVAMGIDFRPVKAINGLPNMEVRRMTVGRDGRLWIATTSGLCFYDGYSFRSYRNSAATPHTLSNNNVRCLAEDKEGHLIIGTNKGLDILDIRSGNIRQSKAREIEGEAVFELYVTRSNDIYVCLGGKLLKYCMKTDKCTEIRFEGTGMVDPKMLEDSRGCLWIGSKAGLYRVDPTMRKWRKFTRFSERNKAHYMVEDRRHRLWVGSFNKGLTMVDNPWDDELRTKTYDTSNGLQDYCIYALAEDIVGDRMMVGTRYGLSTIGHSGNGDIVNYTPGSANPMPFNEVDALVVDGSSVWVGTLGGGIFNINLKQPKIALNGLQEVVEKLSTCSVKSMAMVGNRLWLGVGSYGLVVMDTTTGAFTYSEDMADLREYTPTTTLMSILPLSDGSVAMASFFKGLLIRNGGVTRNYTVENTPWINSNCIHSLLEDSKRRLWIGTSVGLSMMSHEGKGEYMAKLNAEGKDLSKEMFQSLIETKPDGHIWAGTKDAGLLRINPDNMQVELFSMENGKANSNDIQCIYKDSRGRLWVGTEGAGLNIYKDGRLVSVNDAIGLPFETVYSILEDMNGRLWAGTNSGLLCLQPNDDIGRSIFRLYQSTEGMEDNIFLRGCAFRDANGQMFFGGHRGFIQFNPNELNGEVSQAKVYVTDIRIAGLSWYDMDTKARNSLSEVTPQFVERLSLAYDQNNFSIEFSSMNLERPHNEKYSYRLEGYDKTWRIAARFAHRATYNNMPPGHYRFQLRAMNENGSWSHEVHCIDIVVRPPFWLTWYAYTLYIILMAVIAFYVYRYAKRRIRTKVKEQFFTNVTNNMFRPLASVKGNIEYLSQRLPEYSEEFDEMRRNVERQMSMISMEFKNQMTIEMKDVEFKDADKEFIRRAVACVESHLDDDSFDVMQMADEMAMGKTTLYGKLKQLTGMNISAFIRNVRLKAACRMLEKNPNQRISDIAYNVGFSSPKYFSRCFKAEFGMLPKEYVEKFAENKSNKGEIIVDEQ